MRIRTRDRESVLGAMHASRNGTLKMNDLRVDPGTLEDVFLSLTGRELRQ